tara:strand:- start:324255 stop:324584 length:330 start_codon:yes stop_codon:yes gene_type:complete
LAKFKYIEWLLEFLLSSSGFLFEWDEGNIEKSEKKHGVSTTMVESAFEDINILALGEQYQPKCEEDRYGILAKTFTSEVLFVCFTIREGKIRPISARLANKKERSIYDE